MLVGLKGWVFFGNMYVSLQQTTNLWFISSEIKCWEIGNVRENRISDTRYLHSMHANGLVRKQCKLIRKHKSHNLALCCYRRSWNIFTKSTTISFCGFYVLCNKWNTLVDYSKNKYLQDLANTAEGFLVTDGNFWMLAICGGKIVWNEIYLRLS